MTDAIITTAMQVAATLLITLIGVLGAWLTAQIAKKQKLAGIAAATEQVIQAAQTTVDELQQTVVDSLKAAGGGKLTADQIASLSKQLIVKTQAKLGEPVINLLTDSAVDVDALITGAGEAWISRIKAITD